MHEGDRGSSVYSWKQEGSLEEGVSEWHLASWTGMLPVGSQEST